MYLSNLFIIFKEKLMYFPTWVDLKGEDAVPDTVHHVVVKVDPQTDKSWHNLQKHVMTDGVRYFLNSYLSSEIYYLFLVQVCFTAFYL